ncbi:CDC68-related [Euphorbia peplus]|nr:CDC68-related [Euphorbia peplus]
MAEEIILIRKQEKRDLEEEEESSPWSQFLPELMSQTSLYVFRGGGVDVLGVIPSVCKSWKHSFDINHATTLIRASIHDPPINALSPEYPCLIALKGSSCTFYHPTHTFLMDFPELSGFYIRSSKFGWLLMCCFPAKDDVYDYTYFFFNPFTRQKIDIPSSDETFYSMCFSSPPTSRGGPRISRPGGLILALA